MRGSFTDSVGFSPLLAAIWLVLSVWVGDLRVNARGRVPPACLRGASGGLPARV